ncbi:MAG: heavy metal-responsive transcriptional regulator [Bryobacteraceae bacterium]
MRSGELAKRSGVSPDTLRHYERIGVLARPRRTAGGYRDYAESAVVRVQLVRRAVALGFSLNELSRILQVREQGGAPCRQVAALLESKLTSLETEIAERVALRDALRGLLDDWSGKLAGQRGDEPLHLLQALVELPIRRRTERNLKT